MIRRSMAVITHRARYTEIAQVLSRHGLGYLGAVAGLDRRVPLYRRLVMSGQQGDQAPPVHVRLALEELGATFVKLGQILSTRPDLMPVEYQLELAKLHDAAPPVPGPVVRELISEELGCAPEDVFATFDMVPLAAASIGQAHAATLADGTEVVVKIRRPGVVEQVEEDLEILQNLAAQANRRWAAAGAYDLVALVEEFAWTIRGELDYLREGRNAERFAGDFVDDPDVHIPRVFWATSTSRVLTLERLRGLKVSDTAGLDAAGIDRRALAERATRVTARMIFEHGFFHADPHPGNLFIEPDGRIGLVDFGMVGTLDEELRERLSLLLLAIGRTDADRITTALLNLGVATEAVDRVALRRDVKAFVRRYEGRSLGEIKVSALVNEVFAVMRRHRLQLPRELVLILKMVVMTEGMGSQLDPQFQLGSVLRPYAEQLVVERLSPVLLARRLQQAGVEVAQLGVELPDLLRRLVRTLDRDLDRDKSQLNIRIDNLDEAVARLEKLGNRVIAGTITAALLGGLGELVASQKAGRKTLAAVYATGAGATGTLAAYLGWSGLRGHRPRRRLPR
ncbi:MAG: ABC1 family protein [uncultured Solirubrobacteraceae bacterium]|uniref:ABC1 family protein n=1 Tax=uncultured Solirubrobacteraceae bacterium TaxID=1162706 RepID=A0A6J4SEK4_9ACTN|nr:MAG: ABC1 family protein [uncultured Solirubrobacteraceae bacterium]